MSADPAEGVPVGATFWSCQTHDVPGASGAIYEDILESQYAYDSLVVNSGRIRVGDVLVLRDAHLVRGYGVVERIDVASGDKVLPRCPRPECLSADIKPRKVKRPVYRCRDCFHEFDEPEQTRRPVTRFVAHYGDSWSNVGTAVPIRALKEEAVYANGDFPNSIRELDGRSAIDFLRRYADLASALNLEILAWAGVIPGGRTSAVTQVRRGQTQFRDSMFERFGSVCAVTGRQPADVLDAAHLYSFAAQSEHRRDGGLLLRSDVHRLFDRLLLTFDPATWSSAVAPSLLDRFESLAPLHGVPISAAEDRRPDRSLIAVHYDAARERWRDLAE
jgi:hypothetical protein